jgi:hypothetical protein
VSSILLSVYILISIDLDGIIASNPESIIILQMIAIQTTLMIPTKKDSMVSPDARQGYIPDAVKNRSHTNCNTTALQIVI